MRIPSLPVQHSQCNHRHAALQLPPAQSREFKDFYTPSSPGGFQGYSPMAFALAVHEPGEQIQMGAWSSSQFSSGSAESGAHQQQQWSASLDSVPYKCYYCNGSGDCQNDYPRAGSGKDGNGEEEYRCGGSGDCQKCDGDGILLN